MRSDPGAGSNARCRCRPVCTNDDCSSQLTCCCFARQLMSRPPAPPLLPVLPAIPFPLHWPLIQHACRPCLGVSVTRRPSTANKSRSRRRSRLRRWRASMRFRTGCAQYSKGGLSSKCAVRVGQAGRQAGGRRCCLTVCMSRHLPVSESSCFVRSCACAGSFAAISIELALVLVSLFARRVDFGGRIVLVAGTGSCGCACSLRGRHTVTSLVIVNSILIGLETDYGCVWSMSSPSSAVLSSSSPPLSPPPPPSSLPLLVLCMFVCR
jgi:hypothetical protein